MKQFFYALICILCAGISAKAQTLTLVTGKKIYDHHSSSLANGAPYGNFNVNTQSAYDFVNHTNVPSGSFANTNKDLVEHNGYFGNNGINGWGLQFGFTNTASNIGSSGYLGNNISRFYPDNSLNFSALNTVSDLMTAYNAAQAVAFDTAVAVGNIYIGKIRNNGQYIAMRITQVSNVTPAEAMAMDNGQSLVKDVFFEFEYKWGIYTPPVATGIKDNELSQPAVTLFPSPAQTHLQLSAAETFTHYRITTLTGALAGEGSLGSTHNGTIEVSQLKAGIYVLELGDAAGMRQRNKFIKE